MGARPYPEAADPATDADLAGWRGGPRSGTIGPMPAEKTPLDAGRVFGEVENAPLLALVGAHRRVLDVGCGVGRNGAALRARGARVTGVTASPAEAERARAVLDAVEVLDLEGWAPPAEPRYDALVLSHVLEHLVDPWGLLGRLVARALEPGGRAYVALPNLLFCQHRLELLRGRFRYSDHDIMDRSHLRWFDPRTSRELLTGAGLEVERFEAPGYVPLRALRRVLPAVVQRAVDRGGSRLLPGLFGLQYLLVGRKP